MQASRIIRKGLALALALCMLALGWPVAANEDDPSPEVPEAIDSGFYGLYTVVAEGGTVTDVITGETAAERLPDGTVVEISLDAAFSGYTFDAWKSSFGDVIPAATFRLKVERDIRFTPTFTDFSPAYGAWELVSQGSCEEGDLYVRRDPISGLSEYKTEYFNYGNHDFGSFVLVDDEHCARVCNRCGYTEMEEHYWDETRVITEPTHSSEGLAQTTCYRCGSTVNTVLPKATEHVWNADGYSNYGWEIIQPSENGQYGLRRRHCQYCDAYEDYWYLGIDFQTFFKDKEIRYQETYGGKVTNNELYLSWTDGEGRTTYTYGIQYVYGYSSGNDSGQTFVFMWTDDGDPTVRKPIYLSKTKGTSSVDGFLWGEYGYALDFDDWFDAIRHPDYALTGSVTGMGFGNTMGARASLLTAWGDDWAETFNKAMIPADQDPADFTSSTGGQWRKWEIDQDDFDYARRSTYIGVGEDGYSAYEYSGGLKAVTYRQWVSGNEDSKVFDYVTVDKASGVCVGKDTFTTAYRTSDRTRLYDAPVSTEAADIVTLIRNFSGEQGRASFSNNLTLEPSDPLSAVRVIVSGPYKEVSVPNWSFYYNDSRMFRVQNPDSNYESYNMTFGWSGEDDPNRAFDRWEIFDFDADRWVTLSTSPTVTVNTRAAPLTGVTLLRIIDHEDTSAASLHVTVEGGTFQVITSSNTYYYESEGNVTPGAYVVPVANYGDAPEGMQFDHWEVWQDGRLVEDPAWFTYRYSECLEIQTDTVFRPAYVPQTYYLDVSAEGGEVYLDGSEEPFYGGEFESGAELTFTTVGYDHCPYFYGWFLETWGKEEMGGGGPETVLLTSDTTLHWTMNGNLEGRLIARWGETEEMPLNYHDVTVVGGFITRYNWSSVSAYRVPDYQDFQVIADPTAGVRVTQWTMQGTLDGEPYEETHDADVEDHSRCSFYVQDASSTPHLLTITGTGESESHTHELQHHPAVPAGCLEPGCTEYWVCDACGRLFADAEGAQERSPAQVALAPLGHDWGEWTVTTPAGAGTPGVESHVCARDPSHTEDRLIPAAGSQTVELVDVGNIWYWLSTAEPVPFTAEINPDAPGLTDQMAVAEECWTGAAATVALTGGEGQYLVPGDYNYAITLKAKPGYFFADGFTFIYGGTTLEPGEYTAVISEDGSTLTLSGFIPTVHLHGPVQVAAVPATCTATGHTAYWICEGCGKYFADADAQTELTEQEITLPVDPAAHAWGEDYEHNADGHWPVCTRCGAHGETAAHAYGEWQAGDAQGHEHRCAVCGRTEKDAHTAVWRFDDDAHWQICGDCDWIGQRGSHTWDNGQITTAPGCEQAGEKTYTCTVCGATRTEPVEADGHNWANDWQHDAEGHWQVCTVDNAVSDKQAHVWDNGQITTAPGCEKAGEKTYTCTVCGATRTEPVEADGHNWSNDWQHDADSHWHACDGCDQTADRAAHTFGDWQAADTHMAHFRTCTVCGYTEEAPHTAADWQQDADGHWHVCDVCGFVFDRADHAWDNGAVTREPDEDHTGERTFTCDVCGAVRTEEIPALVLTVETGALVVNDALKTAGLETVEAVEQALSEPLADAGYLPDNYRAMEVTLLVSLDGGKTFIEATADTIGPDGVTVTLPYPEGLDPTGLIFTVVHMFTTTTDDHKVGDVEVLTPTLTDKGLEITVHSLSPMMVAWKEAAAPAPDYTPGDINGDGSVNAADALLALQHSVKLIELEGDKALAADVSGDGSINAADALLILQKSVKLIDVFPVEK